MADAQANININIETSQALANLKNLQRQISLINQSMSKSGGEASRAALEMQRNLLNSINATGRFSASMTNISSTAENFTNALEKNKLSMREYFRYAGGASQTFGKIFRSEFDTIEKVARERVKTLQTQYIKLGRDANGALKGIAVRPLALDMQNLGTQVMMTAQRQQIFNQLLKQGSTNLLNFGKNTQWAGRQLMVGFTIPLTILGTTAARVFMEIEEQVIRFKRVYGEFSTSAEEADKMARQLRDLAGEFTRYGLAIKDTLEMAADAAAMGKMGNDLLAQVEQASRLAVLGGVEQKQALETTISLTNTFGIATEELTDKIAFLNAVENQTVVSIEDLTEAIPKAGPVVQQLGGDVEDLAFFLTAMKEGGINASEGANALKSGLASLINPTGKAKEMLQGFGINIDRIVEGNAGNVKGLVIDFANALDTLDPLNRARAIEQLFGKFQFSRLSTLFQNVVAEGNQASRVLELTKATTEELGILAERELARVEESTGYKFKKALEDVKGALAPVGEEFLKAITPFIGVATKILNWFNNLSDGAKQFGVIAVAAIGVVAPTFLMLFGLVANGFANLIKGVSKVGTFFGFLSGQTKLVGGGFQYMTSEQLESAAVAASLEQVHQRLIQVFTSEASSVQALAAAYRQAVPALNNFTAAGGAAATRGGKGKVPKKYNKGIVMVPGPKGKGDVVPAMLTPGEAVIPAEQTAKYIGLIRGIVADNIPGYENSNISPSVARSRFGMSGTSFAHTTGGASIPVAELQQAKGLIGEIARMFVQIGSAAREANVKNRWGVAQDQDLNARSVGGAPLSELAADRAKLGPKAWYEGVAGGGVDPNTIPKEIEQYDTEFNSQITRAADAGVKFFTDTEANLERQKQRLGAAFNEAEWTSMEALDAATAKALPGSPVTAARKTAIRNARELRFTTMTQAEQAAISESGDAKLQDLSEKYFMTSGKNKPRRRRGATRAAPAGLEIPQQGATPKQDGASDAKEYQKGFDSQVGPQDDPYMQIRDRKSPHSRSAPDGADDAKAYSQSFDNTIKKSPLAPPTAPDIAAQPQGKLAGLRGKAKALAAKAGNKVTDALLTTSIGQRGAQFFADTSGGDITDSKGNVVATARALEDLDGQVGKLGKTAKKASKDVGEVSSGIDSDIAYDDEQNPILGPDGRALTKKQMQQEANRQRRQRRAGMVAGIAGTATMAVGMATQIEGPIGQFAQTLLPAVGAFAALGPILLALPGPIALAVAALGAFAGVLYLSNKYMEKAYDETYKLARAMGVGTEAMKKFSDFAGTVGASEIMERRRQERLSPFVVAPGKQTFGSAFTMSEEGQQFVNTVRGSLNELGRDQTVNSIFSQLGNAVAQNILTAEQARSIAGNLGIALGDVGLGMEVNAKLIELLGPNGENFLNDPISLQVRLVEAQTEGLQATLDEYQNIQDVVSPFVEGIGSAGGIIAAARGAATGGDMTAFQELVEAEKQRRYDESGFWGDVATFFTSPVQVGKQLVQEQLGLIGASVADSMSQQQQIIDTIRLQSEEKIAKAIEDGATYEEIKRLREEEADAIGQAIDAIKEQTQKSISILEELSTKDQQEQQKQLRQRLLEQELPEGVSKADVGAAFDKMFASGEFKINYLLSTAYESGDFTFEEFKYISELPQERKQVYYDISMNLGSGEASQISQIANLIKDGDVRSEFELSFKGLEGSDLADAIAQAEEVAKLANMLGEDITIAVDFALKNPEYMQNFMSDLDEIEIRSKEGGWDANITLMTEILGAEEVRAAQEGILANQAEFDALPDEMQLRYGAYFTLFADIAAANAEMQALMEQATGLKGPAAVAAYVMDYMASVGPDKTTAPGAEEPVSSGGGGAPEQFDPLLKKLRDVRLATIDLKRGWDGMMQSLQNVFKGGTQAINVFDGLSNQIRKMGVGENLIEMIVGMDPDEYNKRKKDLFVFDKAGNIVGTTAKLKNLQAAFNAIAIGEYVNSQQQFIENTKNQISAISILTANGMSLAEAYELVQDEALAAAIAMGATKAEIQEILRITKMAAEIRKRSEAEEKRANAAKSVRETNEEFARRVAVLDKLAKSAGKYTDEQINAILSDTNLQQLFLDPSIDRRALNQAIANASRNAEIELKVKLATTEGKKTVFDEAFGKAMEAFSAQEQKINLKFQADIADEESIIKQAENQIAALQFQLDDYEAELTRIEEQEQDINDSYDKRFEALDKVAQANERIAASQRSQLDIADALSRGDIAAAARAAQEARAKQADFAVQSEREMLERARDAQIAGLTGRGGQTREQIEENMRNLRMQIFNIEEDQLEPAQENIRLAEILRDQEIESLMVLGKTREEWENIQNSIDMAQINNWKFVESMQAGLDIVQQLIAELGMAKPLPVEPEPEPSGGGGGGGGGAPAAPAATRPSGTPNNTPIRIISPATPEQISGSPYSTQIPTRPSTIRPAEGNSGSPYIIPQSALISLPNRPSGSPYTLRRPANPPSRFNPVTRAALKYGGGMIKMAMGGKVKGYASGGMFKPFGTDVVPAMLTPGEFVIRRPAVSKIGVDKLEKINRGSYGDGAVYNYNLAVNVKSDADPSKIAQTVIREIKRVDSQRIRGNKF